MTTAAAPATVVLIHGAWHGPWCFNKVTAGLEARGVPVVCVDRRRPAGPNGEIWGADDADENERMTREQIADVEGPIVMLGHSFGGQALTVAPLGDDRVKHLVYLTAMLPDAEGAYPPVLIPPHLLEALDFHDDGSSTVKAEVLRQTFYHQCSDEDFQFAQESLVPDNAHQINPWTPKGLAYKEKPATYVVCTDDQALTAEGQRIMAKECSQVVEWATDHSPFFSNPQLLIDLLDRLAQEHAAQV